MAILESVSGGLHVGKTKGRKQQVKPSAPPKARMITAQAIKDNPSQFLAQKKFKNREFVVEGQAVVIPNPDTRANTIVTIEGTGKIMSGNYYAETVTHTWSREGYNMELELKSNVAGGMKKTIYPPPRKPPAKPKPAPSKAYVVRSGDTLWDIASRYYGSGLKWRKIWEANKAMLIKRDRRNASDHGHWIYPGQRLTIPS